MTSDRIKELQKQIAELERRWPAHSVTPTMLQQLEELEAELERELNRSNVDQQGPKDGAHRTGRPASSPSVGRPG